MVAKRFQIQERMGFSIHRIMSAILSTDNVIVMIEGEHSCMTARGMLFHFCQYTVLHITVQIWKILNHEDFSINGLTAVDRKSTRLNSSHGSELRRGAQCTDENGTAGYS